MSVGNRNATSALRVEVAERLEAALTLRKSGLSFAEIGKKIGVSKKTAHKRVKIALQRLNERCAESAAELQRLELERLDDWLHALQPKIKKADVRAVEVALKIAERRSRLLGLDAPPQRQTTSDLALLAAGEMNRFIVDVREAKPPELPAPVSEPIKTPEPKETP